MGVARQISSSCDINWRIKSTDIDDIDWFSMSISID